MLNWSLFYFLLISVDISMIRLTYRIHYNDVSHHILYCIHWTIRCSYTLYILSCFKKKTPQTHLLGHASLTDPLWDFLTQAARARVLSRFFIGRKMSIKDLLVLLSLFWIFDPPQSEPSRYITTPCNYRKPITHHTMDLTPCLFLLTKL